MNFGEIKADALRLMGIEQNSENSQYYLGGMNNAILRAFDRMVMCEIAPKISVDLPSVTRGEIQEYSLSALSVGEFCGVIREKGLFTEALSVIRNGDCIKVYRTPEDNARAIFITDIGNPANDTQQANLPDRLCRMIPYFVKGEIYEEEEPSVAASARNTFESLLDEYCAENANACRAVTKIYEV